MNPIVPFAFVILMVAAAMHLTTAVAASAGARTALSAEAARLASVKARVSYKGKGTVDAQHRIWVWLFDTPDIGAGSIPIAQTSIDANGAVAEFDVGAAQIWIAVAYDESGTMRGDGPPPPGSPIGIFANADGSPRSVVPGSEAVTLVFDDSQRMP